MHSMLLNTKTIVKTFDDNRSAKRINKTNKCSKSCFSWFLIFIWKLYSFNSFTIQCSFVFTGLTIAHICRPMNTMLIK